jgi:hypothetical protein
MMHRNEPGGVRISQDGMAPTWRSVIDVLKFQRFLNDTAAKGGSINVMFEERLFALVGTLERIAKVLAAAEIPFELIGGGAVMVHVNRVEPSAVRNTKDIDILINRADLKRIKGPRHKRASHFVTPVWTCCFRPARRRPGTPSI